MKRSTRRGLAAIALTAFLTPAIFAVGTGAGATTVTTVNTIDVTDLFPGGVLVSPCATVTNTGSIHQVTHVTALPRGFTQMTFISHPQGITGVSETGATYHAGGSTAVTMVAKPGSTNVLTVAAPFLLVGEGSAPDIQVITVMHVTVNANGTTTSTVDNSFFVCE